MATTPHPDLARAQWVKSRHSANGGNCVEIARGLPATIAVRDSKNPAGPILTLTLRQWRELTSRIKEGHLNPI
jgi:Domain of unknown function (DUF397)